MILFSIIIFINTSLSNFFNFFNNMISSSFNISTRTSQFFVSFNYFHVYAPLFIVAF